MAHGYLGDCNRVRGEFNWDQGDEQRFRDQRNWREEGWSESDDEDLSTDRNREAMFGRWNQDRQGEDRWSGSSMQGNSPEFGFGGSEGENVGRRRYFSTNPDEHYLSWRDRHMRELDRDYEDYCRERELQFHNDFERWRSERHSGPQPLATGMTPSGLSADPTGQVQVEEDSSPATPKAPDPIANTTLGTSSSGRRRG